MPTPPTALTSRKLEVVASLARQQPAPAPGVTATLARPDQPARPAQPVQPAQPALPAQSASASLQALDHLVRELPFVRVLTSKPDAVLDVPAIWPSASQPGTFGVSFPGNKDFSRYQDIASAREGLVKYQSQQQEASAPEPAAPDNVVSTLAPSAGAGVERTHMSWAELQLWRANLAPVAQPPRADKTEFTDRPLTALAVPPRPSSPIVEMAASVAPQRGVSLDDLKKAAAQRWGHQVTVLASYPEPQPGYPAIWPSKSVPGGYGVAVPGKGCYVAQSLDEVQPFLVDQLTPGRHIQASSTNLPEAARLELMARHNIDITPVILDGKEIAYVFHGKGKYNPTMMLSSHGNGREGRTFTKPGGVEFQFATPDNTVMSSRTMEYAKRLKDKQIAIADDQIYMSAPRLNSTNYSLDGGIGTQPQDVAQLIGEINRDGAARPFDFVLLNREAKNVYFADLMTGLQQTMNRLPTTLVAHFCRPKDDNAPVFDVLKR
ncbi:hypothetical protein [Duganella qianjiadongensis]|uniref:Uncharacterized protein n=1 Tax=Duganella qianjiadongensis TaxID=2692176 RepID=A0ABW9VH40_9BURK|nr:hypothetical protein [Duganella qianjiadongensis]MYM38778.1 hypothetical protein [Duganella qianjiadongensis]